MAKFKVEIRRGDQARCMGAGVGAAGGFGDAVVVEVEECDGALAFFAKALAVEGGAGGEGVGG
jgi:hypothetical protein